MQRRYFLVAKVYKYVLHHISMASYIDVKGAKEHNLRGISLKIPKNKLVVFTGVSGSGKSSLVFNTLFAEAQRQYLSSLGTYASRALPKFSRPDVASIKGLSPVVMIDQRRLGRNPRSTVGTVTDIYTYLRLLFSRCGEPVTGNSTLFSFNTPAGMCPVCKGVGIEYDIDPKSIIDFEKTLNRGASKHNIFRPGSRYLNIIEASGKLDLDKPIKNYSKKELDFLLYSPHIVLSHKGQGFVQTFSHEGVIVRLKRRAQDLRGTSDLKEATDKVFLVEKPCTACDGSRLNKRARAVKVKGKTIVDLVSMELTELRTFIKTVSGKLATPIIAKMDELLGHLIDIGVGYLSLNQPVGTLSGGESQRVKMARQLGSNLVDLTYILDEPSIGLHPKDISHLISILKKLRDQGNSVLVVEHDPAVIESADYIIDLGPGAGRNGGKVMFEGQLNALKRAKSLTGEYLIKKFSTTKNAMRRPSGTIKISKANAHNLKNVSVKVPKGVLTCVTGIAGSGKSSLIIDVFAKEHPKTIIVDQSPAGKSIRSNPATYTGVFSAIRNKFAKATGKSASLFSFNSKGACPKCNGIGFLKVDMHFLESVNIDCDLCEGKRFTNEVLGLKYKGKNIFDVLEMTISDASKFFDSKEIGRRLSILEQVGLGYLTLGQPLDSLSGGEAQRIKLAKELHKKGNIYILDEPTTGLHMADIAKLLDVLNNLVELGNTVIVIEHNLDIIRRADWIIDLGPEGGDKGGRIIAEGTPEDVAKVKKSYTGQYLKKVL